MNEELGIAKFAGTWVEFFEPQAPKGKTHERHREIRTGSRERDHGDRVAAHMQDIEDEGVQDADAEG